MNFLVQRIIESAFWLVLIAPVLVLIWVAYRFSKNRSLSSKVMAIAIILVVLIVILVYLLPTFLYTSSNYWN